jgi:A/G-specific adenine glycosylase
LTHVLTHKDLFLHTWRLPMAGRDMHWGSGTWIPAQQWPDLGLPAPIRKLLQQVPTP